jgi:hypothetical protein
MTTKRAKDDNKKSKNDNKKRKNDNVGESENDKMGAVTTVQGRVNDHIERE